jgi:hypothetical protein
MNGPIIAVVGANQLALGRGTLSRSMFGFVQKSAEALKGVIPAQAGIQWRVVGSQQTLPGLRLSPERRR